MQRKINGDASGAVSPAPEGEPTTGSTTQASNTTEDIELQLLDANDVLMTFFAPRSRPSLRWLRMMTEQRALPYIRLGRLVFYRRETVRAALARLEGVTSSSCDALVEVAGLEAGAAVGGVR